MTALSKTHLWCVPLFGSTALALGASVAVGMGMGVSLTAPLASVFWGVTVFCAVMYPLALMTRQAAEPATVGLSAEQIAMHPPTEDIAMRAEIERVPPRAQKTVEEPFAMPAPQTPLPSAMGKTSREASIEAPIITPQPSMAALERVKVAAALSEAVFSVPDAPGLHKPQSQKDGEEDHSTCEIDIASLRDLVRQHSGQFAALQIQDKNPGKPTFSLGEQVLATWPDGRSYQGRVMDTRGDHCLCRFADGQEHWMPCQDLTRT